nr:4-oxalomesaconate tautomerase [Baekduia alba]
MQMRGGTSKGLYFVATDLPADPAERDALLLSIMGSGDPRQIDGLGGAVPLTSKVAIVSPSDDHAFDVDYLFLQLGVGEATVSDRQTCGNLLAGVGPFAVERALTAAGDAETEVRIRAVNTGAAATVRFATPGGRVAYGGDTAIAGVPGTAGRVDVAFADTVGSSTGALLPTGNLVDEIDGVPVTCVDNGMPVVVAEAASFGLTGHEPYEALRADDALQARIDALRRQAGELMGLGDVRDSSVPKTTLVAPPAEGDDGVMLQTRTFIPVVPHSAIGILGAVSVATAVLLPGAVGHHLAAGWPRGPVDVTIGHPSGRMLVALDVGLGGEQPEVRRSAVVRTARKLADGVAFPR